MESEAQYLNLGSQGAGGGTQGHELFEIGASHRFVERRHDVERQSFYRAVAGALHIEIQHLLAKEGFAQILLVFNHLREQGERTSDGGGLAHPRHT